MNRGKIVMAFAFGGKAAEHDLSVKSALYLMAHLDREKFQALCVYVDPEGALAGRQATERRIWSVLDNQREPVFDSEDSIPPDFGIWLLSTLPPEKPDGLMRLLLSGDVDLVFPVFHGQGGEDGLFQGFLETLRIPYIGCGVSGSVIGNDKAYNKAVCRNAGIRVADFLDFDREQWQANSGNLFIQAVQDFGYPLFVKPPCLGSSIGVSRATDSDSFYQAVGEALRYGNRVLVEKALPGKEYGIGIIGNAVLMQSAVVEFGGEGTFLDYESKYGPEAYADIIPAPLSPGLEAEMRRTADRIYRLLGLRGMARLDFFVVRDHVYFNEANTVPGFGRTSVFSKMWAHAGIELQEMIGVLADFALEGYFGQQEGESALPAALGA